MRRLLLTAAAAALTTAPVAAQSTIPVRSPTSPPAPHGSAETYQPKIHIVEVVDESGCQRLNGGVASSGGVLAGGLLARTLKRGPLGIKLASEAGKEAGNQIDRKARCTQTINIEPGLER